MPGDQAFESPPRNIDVRPQTVGACEGPAGSLLGGRPCPLAENTGILAGLRWAGQRLGTAARRHHAPVLRAVPWAGETPASAIFGGVSCVA